MANNKPHVRVKENFVEYLREDAVVLSRIRYFAESFHAVEVDSNFRYISKFLLMRKSIFIQGVI